MTDEIGFGRVIRTLSAAHLYFLVQIETVEQALDGVQELPLATLGTKHWCIARQALWRAVDYPSDTAQLATADQTLRAALATEGWLDETPLN